MKVTVTFGDTAVVVPCKPGWNVRDLIEQATRRYRRIMEQHGQAPMKTHHLEYTEGGILDMDDLLTDLVEDRDKLVAVLEDSPRGGTDSPGESISNGYASSAPSPAPSPEPLAYFPHLEYREPIRGEIEVNEDILKANTPLLVRSSSDSALAPPLSTRAPPLSTPSSTPIPDDSSNGSPLPEVNNVLRGALDRLRTESPPAKMSQVNFSTLTRPVDFPGDWGPLGIHVVPYCSSLSGRTLGLHIKGIEEGGRAQREALFQEDECIVQINGMPLQDKTFAQSQEVFRQAMATPSVRLELLPVANKPRYEKSVIGQLFTADGHDPPATTRAKSPAMALTRPTDAQEHRPSARQETRLPETRAKTPEPDTQLLPSCPEAPERGPPSPTMPRSPLPGRSPAAVAAIPTVTSRKGGKKVKIDLRKGPEGLGFTVVTRDTSLHGPGPILVKNILPRGAAVKDGRLQPGDRILEVNGVDMTGRSQEELVAMLRSTRQGESVSVVVARQEDLFLPRELKGEDGGGSLVLEDGREQLMYEVPLNETGSAGLGVSLKGNKSRETGEDLGIFIKSIIHGGAAYKDGRLTVNDQLIAVNGESLLGRSNHAAMEALRRSMSSEGNSRGTIQLVVLRAPRQMSSTNQSLPDDTPHGPASFQPAHDSQDPRGYSGSQGPPRSSEGPGHARSYSYGDVASSSAASSNGNYDDYDQDDMDRSFPPPPSPGSVEELSRDPPLDPSRRRDFQRAAAAAAAFCPDDQVPYDRGNVPRNRASKSMDLVADESNLGALVERRNDPSAGGALGPTLGLMKSSSLESLQTAVSEAQQKRIQAQVPFHRPRPHMVRGRGCNQSFRIAIDKSYDGPSEDDDDLSEQSSGHETPASGSSRQGLDVDDGAKKKKKTKGKKKEKKSKGKKKADEPAEDPEKKTKRRGFGLLRFGKKKDDKSKEAAKGPKVKLESLNEEEQERIPDIRDDSDPRLLAPVPDVEDDDSDPNYARINHFLQPPPQRPFVSRTPSPVAAPAPVALAPAPEELDGLYAKVNKQRVQANQQSQVDSDQRLQGRWDQRQQQHGQPRAAPGYEELDVARRRVLEHDPYRMAPREPRAVPQYDERQRPPQARWDRYDYPALSRDPAHYDEPPPSRVPLPQAGTHPHRGVGQQQQRRQYEARPDNGYRQASPERFGYENKRQPDPRRKNPAIGAV